MRDWTSMRRGALKGYKLFRVLKGRPGELFPLFVDSNNSTPIGEWVDAKEGERTDSGKVKSKLGELCFRPGWHLSDIPLAVHIGVKDESGNIIAMHKDHIWCECEYTDNIDYQEIANKNGMKDGKLVPKFAYLEEIPKDGYYRYKTNPMQLGNWIIAGGIKIERVLSDDEVAYILIKEGYEPMEREGGPIDLEKYGF